MKKLIAILMVLCLFVVATACGSKPADPKTFLESEIAKAKNANAAEIRAELEDSLDFSGDTMTEEEKDIYVEMFCAVIAVTDFEVLDLTVDSTGKEANGNVKCTTVDFTEALTKTYEIAFEKVTDAAATEDELTKMMLEIMTDVLQDPALSKTEATIPIKMVYNEETKSWEVIQDLMLEAMNNSLGV